MIRTIILFLIIFGIVVISHELGHFLIGKRNGIRVNEFFVGMGPTLFSFEKGGTKYSLKLLPLGGACVFDGEDGVVQEDEEEDGSMRRKAGIESVKEPGEPEKPVIEREGTTFPEASVWKRIAAVFAGPFFNFILAFIFALIIVAFNGSDKPVVMGFMEGSAAEEAGMRVGDVITKIGHERIHLYREISLISELNKTKGETLEIHYLRDGVEGVAYVTPAYYEENGRYYMGFLGSGEYIDCNPLQAFQYTFYEMEYLVKLTYKSLGMLFTGQATKDDVSGPIGIAQLVGDTYEEVKPYGISSVVLTMMNIVVLLSVNLGIINLLPLPALDGGRLLFMLVEVVRGKPVPPEKEGMVHFAGLVVLMILMVFIMYNDIMKLVR